MKQVDPALQEPLTPNEVMVIPYIEKFWHENGFFPPQAKLAQRGVQDPQILYKKTAFTKAMENRGIDLNATNVDSPVDLSKAQMAAIMVMADYFDKRSAHSKMRNLGLTTTQWNAWMKQKKFKEYFHNLTSKNFEEAIGSIQTGLTRKAEEGDINAIKYYYEITGRHNSGDQTNQNIRLIITRLVEVLLRRIKDPELLAAIQYDFQLVLDGESTAPEVPQELLLPGVSGEL